MSQADTLNFNSVLVYEWLLFYLISIVSLYILVMLYHTLSACLVSSPLLSVLCQIPILSFAVRFF